MSRRFILGWFLFLVLPLAAQVPNNYYDQAVGLTGSDLLQKLHDIITNGHTPISYSDIWAAFAKTDVRFGGDTIWDMYSDVPGGTPPYIYMVGDDQCGTYSQEGDCYNREHSFPKSWWGSTTDEPQYTDLNHIFATDGYVNSKRSNYPYGDVGSADWTSLNGSKLGSCSHTDYYTGTVFEPIDEYKGDVARALFYMATRYKDEIPTWVSDNSSSTDIDVVFNSDGTFKQWYYEMMYQWHIQDPVSEKERRRNDSVYNEQGNANPYIDHPEYVCMVFGNLFVDDPQNLAANSTSDTQIDLSWDLNSNSDTVMLAYSTDGFFGMPNGKYSAGDAIEGGGTVLYVGTATSFSHTGLTSGQKYYYKLWSKDASGRYSCGIITDATAGQTSGSSSGDYCASDLIISEYGEGSSNNKYLELYNGTNSDVDLSEYTITIYYNGNTSGTNITLNSTTLAPGEVYVIANSNAASDILDKADQTSGSLSFNGNDAVVLKHNGTAIDQIGVVGEDPGTGWSVAGISNATANHTLVRKATVTSGTTDWSESAGTDADNSQWVVYDSDTWTDLGSHTMDCGSCQRPTLAASDLTVSDFSANTITISWTNGDGDYRLVLAKQGANVDATPQDSTTYNANSQFGSGDQIGSGNYVVYSGNGSSVTVTGLTPGTVYYFKVFEYNCSSGSELYLTDNAPEVSHTTKPDVIDDLQVVCADNTSISLTWSAPEGNYDGIIITALENATPPTPTCDPATLNSPNSDYSAAEVYCSNSDNAKYVYNDNGTSVTVTGLTKGQTYHFIAYTYKDGIWSAAGNEISQVAQMPEVTDLTADCGNAQSDLSWTNPNSACFDEVIVAVKDEEITATPSGTYTANSSDYTDPDNPTLADGSVVVYNGTGQSVTVTGLTNGVTYYYKVFVRKGDQWSDGVQTSCMPSEVTVLDYGDLVIVSVNTDYYDSDNRSDDEIEFICFKDITPGTSIDFTDNGYERKTAGRWGDTEGTMRLTRKEGTSIIPAGTLIKIRGEGGGSSPVLGEDWNIWVGGNLDNDNWTIENLTVVGSQVGSFNLNETDQIWMMQGGDWLTNNTFAEHDDQYTGKVLYGWTATGWEDAPGYNSTSGSTLYPGNECSNTDVDGISNADKVTYTGDTSIASHREWLARFNNPANWTGFSTTADYDNGKVLPMRIRISGEGFSQKWVGDQDENWFNCGNWGNLKVPTEDADVTFDAEEAHNNIVFNNGDSAVCRSLTITGSTTNYSIKAQGVNAVLNIKGDLTIEQANALNFDDGDNTTPDGKIIIAGNWINKVGADGFIQGNSTVEFNGTTLQRIDNDNAAEDFYNLIISNTAGVRLDTHVTVADTLILNNSTILDLNGNDLTVSGAFINNSGYFKGNQGSSLTFNGNGRLDNLVLTDDFNLKNLTLDRNDTLNILTDLYLQADMNILQGTIMLAANKFYTVGGNLNNSVGNTGLILLSNASGTASLITNSKNVQAICQRYLSKNKWHYISMPMTEIPTDSLRITSWGAQNPNLYWYDETVDDYWWADGYCSNVNGWTSVTSDILDTTKGYIFYSTEDRTYELTGGYLRTSDVTLNLSYTSHGTGDVTVCDGNDTQVPQSEFDGWNLIGNPFTSAIDWDSPDIVFNNVNSVIYYYDGESGNYKYYRPASSSDDIFNHGITINGGSRYVPANQAFMIKAVGDNPSITIPASARVHASAQFLKKSQNALPEQALKLEIRGNGWADQTAMQFTQYASDIYDPQWDALKHFAVNPDIPQIFSIDPMTHVYAINTLPSDIDSVPLGVRIPKSGYYTINLIAHNSDNLWILLKDTAQNSLIDLLDQRQYGFYAQEGLNYQRFALIVRPNHPPVANQLPIITVELGENFSFTLPQNAFYDQDPYDQLTITVDSATLPQWLQAKNITLSGLANDTGTYYIRFVASDRFGLTAENTLTLMVVPTGLKPDNAKIQIYPNPATDYIYVLRPESSSAELKITDMLGQVLISKPLTKKLQRINISDLAQGAYILIISDNKQQFTVKLIKR